MRSWRATFLRAFLHTVGRLSDGVRLCIQDGPTAGTTLEHAYRNVPAGKGWVGRWIDRRFLRYEGWERVRQRRAAVEAVVEDAIGSLQGEGRCGVHVLDLAGGAGDCLLRVVGGGRVGAGVTAVCRDVDEKSLDAGRRRAREGGIGAVRFERGDALDRAAIAAARPVPSVVLSVGLYELISDDAAVRESIGGVAELLPGGGVFVLVHQTQRGKGVAGAELFDDADGLPRTLTLRQPDILRAWLQEAGLRVEQASPCAGGWYVIMTARKERMDLGLYNLKYPARRMMAWVLPAFRHVPPDAISWSIVPVGVATAWLYWCADAHRWFLLAGSGLILVRMFLATLDGLVAVTFQKSTPLGEIVNRVPAEISDVLLLGALAMSSPDRFVPGVAALGVGWLITFAGLVGLTAGRGTQSVGPAGSTDRLAALIAFSVAGYGMERLGRPFDAMKWYLIWVACGGALTILLRLGRAMSKNEKAR